MEANSVTLKPSSAVARKSKPRSKNKSTETVRKTAFYFALALTFVRCSQIHELIQYQFNVNSYLLFLTGIPAILGLVISKSIARPFRFPQAYYWLGFSLWLILIIPFSVWSGIALLTVKDYWRTNVPLVFIIGGLTRTWEEFEHFLHVLAISCLSNLFIIKYYGQLDSGGRMALPFGAIANSNDYAAHLLMLLPSLLWVALVAKSFKFRVATLGALGYGIYAVLSSGSRGALISVSVGVLYFLFFASKRQKLWVASLAVAMLIIVFSLVPPQVIQRMLSFSKSSSASEEALESSEERSQLLQDAIFYTIRNPISGLGPDNFRIVEGMAKRGMHKPAHNSYVTVACETGLPGLFLFLGGVISSFLTFWRIRRRLQTDPQAKELMQAALCMQLMMITFCLAVGFLNFTYADQFPIMVGISIAMGYATANWRAAKRLQTQGLRIHPEPVNELS
jgi:O-antigen ligase